MSLKVSESSDAGANNGSQTLPPLLVCCFAPGYMFMHDNKLLTVFSASRYCGRGTNRGAFVTFESDLTHTVQQFVAGPLSSTAPALKPPLPSEVPADAYEFAVPLVRGSVAPAIATVAADGSAQRHVASASDDASEAAQEEAIRTMLVERIVMNKPDLYFFWSHLDNAGARDGCVSKMEWADGMRTVLNLDLPWLTLLPSLVDAQADGRINYTVFLDRYRIAMREQDLAWMEGIIETACRNLFSAVTSLEAAFELLDVDKSGTIDYEELERGLAKLDLGLSRSQLYELMSSIDSDRDGRWVCRHSWRRAVGSGGAQDRPVPAAYFP